MLLYWELKFLCFTARPVVIPPLNQQWIFPFFFFLAHFSAAFKFPTEEQEGQQKI